MTPLRSHECWHCGQWCYCDGEDHAQPAPDDCNCPCVEEENDTEDTIELD